MFVRLVAVGRVGDADLRAVCDDYVQRIRRWLKLEIREVAEAGRRGSNQDEVRRVEGERLLGAVPDGAFSVALNERGKQLSSLEFASLVGGWRENGQVVAVLLGGAYGLHTDVLASASLQLSLSRLTLPHDIARVVWLEQLYRAGTILRGEPYHKGS